MKRIFIIAVVIVTVVASLATGSWAKIKKSDSPSAGQFSAADERFFKGFWYLGTAQLTKTLTVDLAMGCPAYVDEQGRLLIDENRKPIDPTNERYRFVERCNQLSKAWVGLLSEDPHFLADWRASEQRIRELVPDTTQEQRGHQLIFHELLTNKIFTRIVAKAGPTTAVVPAAFQHYPVWGSDDPRSGIYVGGRPIIDVGTPAAVVPFHCCRGEIMVSRLGGEFTTYAKRHAQLMESEATYKVLFEKTVAPFIEKARQLKAPSGPTEVEACSQITKELHTRLVEAGIPAYLEKVH